MEASTSERGGSASGHSAVIGVITACVALAALLIVISRDSAHRAVPRVRPTRPEMRTGAPVSGAPGSESRAATGPAGDDQTLGAPRSYDGAIRWISDSRGTCPPSFVERLIAFAEDLPQDWTPHERDSVRLSVFRALGKLTDPGALPLLRRWRNALPEVPVTSWVDEEGGVHSQTWDYSSSVDEAIGRIDFMEAVRHAGSDEEVVLVCCRDMFRGPHSYCIGDPVGETVLWEGWQRYLPYMKQEVAQRPGDEASSLLYLLANLSRAYALVDVESFMLDVARTRSDKAAYSALGVLRTQGTTASLDGLDEIMRANRGFETRAEKELSPGELARRYLFQGAEHAADSIRWRDILARTKESPSDEDLRWAIERFEVSRESRKYAAKRGAAFVRTLVPRLPQMGLTGKCATIDLLGSVLAADATADGLALARELSERRDLGPSIFHHAIQLLGHYGGPEEYGYLTARLESLRAIKKARELSASEWKELDTLDYAARTYAHRTVNPK